MTARRSAGATAGERRNRSNGDARAHDRTNFDEEHTHSSLLGRRNRCTGGFGSHDAGGVGCLGSRGSYGLLRPALDLLGEQLLTALHFDLIGSLRM
jgi:hypothetical protein